VADEAAARVTAQDFVREQIDLVVAFENQTVRAAKAIIRDIPVVCLQVSDPVPGLRRPLVLSEPGDPASRRWLPEVRNIGSALKLQLDERLVRNERDIEAVFRPLKPGDVDGVLLASRDLRVRFHSLILRLANEPPRCATSTGFSRAQAIGSDAR
jgi:hypothetical protein